MTPERKRAHEAVEALHILWHVAGQPIEAVLDAHETVEHLRPIVDLAKAITYAKSGEARAAAMTAMFAAVERLRLGGR
jgi:hypothetical protein